MHTPHSMPEDFAFRTPDLAATPLDEVLPPELPKQAPTAGNDVVVDVLTWLRDLFGRVTSDDREGRVLAVLGPAQVLKATNTCRSSLSSACGYNSELEFFEQSQRVASASKRVWFATPDKKFGGWVLWCDDDNLPADTIQG